jgi:hypothetical protein
MHLQRTVGMIAIPPPNGPPFVYSTDFNSVEQGHDLAMAHFNTN